MHQLFILSSLPAVYCSCLFAFWSYFGGILCRRTHSCMPIGSDIAMYQVRGSIAFVVPCIWVCRLFCFVELDGCEHEHNYTTASSDPGSLNNVCLVANAWYDCSTRYDMRSEIGISTRERPSGKKRQVTGTVSYNFGPAGRTRGSREWPSGRQL